MGIGVSIFFLTVGAILKFAIDPDVLGSAVHIDIIGVIFMIVGAAGLLISFFLLSRRGEISDTEVPHRENHPPTI
ncbi:membrane protein [Sphaerisporangium melleum]|uniref:Membrane protein n=1 Tax=Sphaerisporangium melleum TaxID=321316 RepID=A0A917R117_9ACTN|nr:hypothetical protein [Sphaerisporangium melleum]GGK81158.1 membrane protein [Sphaerisporangium melleum]GII71957.1 membrane protein [Sphaerisporangium melleum]